MKKLIRNLCLTLFTFILLSCDKQELQIIKHKIKGEKQCIDSSLINRNALIPKFYDPVCGCNGQTYSNEVEAKYSGVTSFTKGACNQEDQCIDSTLINHNGIIPEIYDPVCGCNGQTYSNEVEAKYSGVISFTKGACKQEDKCIDSSLIDYNAIIPTYYDPVCGCNGQTYSNEVEAKSNGVLSFTKGTCK